MSREPHITIIIVMKAPFFIKVIIRITNLFSLFPSIIMGCVLVVLFWLVYGFGLFWCVCVSLGLVVGCGVLFFFGGCGVVRVLWVVCGMFFEIR